MAAFTRADSSDRRSFDAHYHRIRDNPDCTVLPRSTNAESEPLRVVVALSAMWTDVTAECCLPGTQPSRTLVG